MASSDTITSQRLEILREYAIMDTPPEQTFDDLTFLASSICETPISAISLLDERRQWFKSRHGLEARETPIEQAFCRHTIKGSSVLEVKDAKSDPRFATNPLVTGEPHIRYYAGVPLVAGKGVNIGALCVIDHAPRALTEVQRRGMRALARQVMVQLELRRSKMRIETTLKEKQAALDELHALQNIIPICAYCKRIRDDKAYWHQLEKYLTQYGHFRFSHGICPECYPEVLKTIPGNSDVT